MPKLEIAALTITDAVAAQNGGADSIEISRDLSVGGLTPDFDLVRRARDAVKIRINVMIRPHADSFIYSPGDVEQIMDDACSLAHLGIDGIVFGALTPDRRLDLTLIEQVAGEAIPLPLTAHRALDESVDPEQALEGLIGIAPRVLTSGPAPDAWSGRFALAKWVRDYGDKLSFVVSGGLRLEQVPGMLATIKAHEYHFGSAARSNDVVDVAKVRLLRAALDQH